MSGYIIIHCLWFGVLHTGMHGRPVDQGGEKTYNLPVTVRAPVFGIRTSQTYNEILWYASV